MARPVNDAGLDLVRTFEGLRTEAYRCPAGVWTIGYGHTGDVQPGQRITAEQAEKILRDDLAACGEQVEGLIRVPLTDCQYAALVSYVFNAGAGNLRGSTLRRRLNAGDYDCVPCELAKWVKATDPNTGRKVSLAGLVRRRAAEGELWLREAGGDAPESGSGASFRTSPDMPQRVQADEQRAASRVNARAGLRLRSGPGLEHDVLRLLPLGTEVFVERQINGWAAVDLEGDGAIDGFVALEFLAAAQA